jgi:multiple sugar transport system ATP-binding protein
LVRSPNAYLMDEPLSSLDAKLRADLRIELKRIQQDLGATVLYVTHDQTEALTLADRVGVMEHGRLVQIGSPRDIYENPVNIFVATRLGSPAINLVPRSLLPDLPAPPGVATIGVRTEHVQLSRSSAGAGVVTRVEHLGDQDHLHVGLADRELVTLSDPDAGLEAGDRVTMQFVRPILFDAAGARVRP